MEDFEYILGQGELITDSFEAFTTSPEDCGNLYSYTVSPETRDMVVSLKQN